MPELVIDADGAGARLDVALGRVRPELSRARWQQLIREGRVLVNGRASKPSQVVKGGDAVCYDIPPPAPVSVAPEALPLEILYEDGSILVLSKPPGMVVHPAPGHSGGTLVNALLHHCRDLSGIGGELRPGIVHRLDRDTSGVMVVAKTEAAQRNLAGQFKGRTVRKFYQALVWGHPRPSDGTIETLVGRSTGNRKKMSARPRAGRPAVTHYTVAQAYSGVSLLDVRIETGRTHQIRVHLAHIGYPVVGDRTYGRGKRPELPAPALRQMLHARTLSFTHPDTGQSLEFEAPLPPDFRSLLSALKESSSVP